MLNLHIRLVNMKYCALILMSSLPVAWIAVGCLLLIVCLILAVLLMLKLREVAIMKKEVMETRETMRMMRYEEASLARMLHTVSKPTVKPKETVAPEPAAVVEECAAEMDSTDALDAEVAEASLEEVITEEILTEEAPAEDVLDEVMESENTETLVEVPTEVEAPVEEAPAEAVLEAVAEAENTEAPVEILSEVEAPVEEPTMEEEPEMQSPIEEAPTEEVPAEELSAEEEQTEESETPHEEVPAALQSQKHPINERRPAIPNDLFSAWFAEYEEVPSEEEEVEFVEPNQGTPLANNPMSTDELMSQAPAAVEEPVAIVNQATEEEAPLETTEVEGDLAYEEEFSSTLDVLSGLSKEDERFCRKLERIVNARLRNPNLNIDIIAAQIGLGRTNFYRKVRELMGTSPNDYLRKCRMERAAELLRNPEMSVSDAAVQVGIPDAQYFSRVFKSYFGISPSVYRENNNNLKVQ